MTYHDTPLRTVGVVLAGGAGTRVGLDIPKQLLKIAGKPILEHAVAAMDAAPEIDEVIVVMHPDFLDEAKEIVSSGPYRKVSQVLAGGAIRSDTTRIAIDALGRDECNVLLHDAVRPLVSARTIRETVNALRTYQAVDVAFPSADTIIAVDDGVISEIPPRHRLWRGQTPQGFRLSVIRKAYELAGQDPDFHATDDCGVVLKYLPEVPIKVVDGSEDNIKVTHPVDVFIADKLFQLTSTSVPQPRSRADYAEHLRGRTLVVFGGSYGIGRSVVDIARGCGADVFSFSRSENGCHIENGDDVAGALATAYENTGRVDYVVITAGLLARGNLAENDEAVIQKMIEVNYVAPVMIARLALPYLQRSRGQLLMYTSSSYTRGRAGYSIYSSTKAAVVNLTQALAEEWGTLGVRVNCINPERTGTPMRTKAFGEEPPDSLLDADAVALTSLDVLISGLTGQVVDVRRLDPAEPAGLRPVAEAARLARSLAEKGRETAP